MSETHICLVLKSMPFYTVETQMIRFFFHFPSMGLGRQVPEKKYKYGSMPPGQILLHKTTLNSRKAMGKLTKYYGIIRPKCK